MWEPLPALILWRNRVNGIRTSQLSPATSMATFSSHLVALLGSIRSPLLAALHGSQAARRGALWKPVLTTACTVAASRNGLRCSLWFSSLGCLVSWCTLDGWKLECLLVHPGHVNLLSNFCASQVCFLSLPAPINKSSHPSIFDWNKIDPRATHGCLCCSCSCLTQTLHPFWLRQAGAKEFSCPG